MTALRPPSQALRVAGRFAAAVALLLGGCGGVFFYPNRVKYASPDEIGVRYDEHVLDDGQGPKLVTWLLRADRPKALVVHFHGNAENMSSHLAGVYWLPSAGYDVLMCDYRGYGGSQGTPSIAGVNEDAARVLHYAKELAQNLRLPLVLWGQSLGASLGLYAAAQPEFDGMFRAIISEAAFSTYRAIAAEKIATSWVTRVAGYPFLLAIPNDMSPLGQVAKIHTGGLLFVHGDADPIVGMRHSEQLFAAAPEPKELWLVSGAGHIAVFDDHARRERLMKFLDAHVQGSGR